MSVAILVGDVLDQLARLPGDHFDVVVTSPPYWGLRDYLVPGQLGLEPTLGEHLANMVAVFREVRRVLKPTGIVWLNYGDCYATSPNGRSAAATKAEGSDDRTFRDKPFSTIQGSLKPKDLCMVPNRLAIALQDDGWWVRSETIWGKANPMPESVSDRPATAHEKVFLLTKSERYAWDAVACRQGAAPASYARWNQNVEQQEGSTRAHAGGKTNGNMKAVGGPRAGRGGDKQARLAAAAVGSSQRRATGFNERWAEKEVARKNSFARETKASAGGHGQKPQHRADREPVDYRSGTRNLRNFEPAPLQVWPLATAPFGGEFCMACEGYFEGAARRKLRVEKITLADGRQETRRYCTCGAHGAWLSHFATFPPDLVEMALAPVFRRCCANCGKPWEREVRKTFIAQADVSPEKVVREAHQHDETSGWAGSERGTLEIATGALRPGCACGTENTVPARVLDPFGGAGTVGLVADAVGLDATLIELNENYAKLARKRIKTKRPTARVDGAESAPQAAGPLFALEPAE